MWYNPIIAFALRSRLHSVVSGSMMLLTYTGRKTRKRYSVPVNYVREGDVAWVTSRRERTWWRNLRGRAAVTVRLKGRDHAGIGRAIADDPDAVLASLRTYFRLVPQWAKYSGVSLDANGEPNLESLKRAAQDKVVIEIRLG